MSEVNITELEDIAKYTISNKSLDAVLMHLTEKREECTRARDKAAKEKIESEVKLQSDMLILYGALIHFLEIYK